jgi:hypothetical protein
LVRQNPNARKNVQRQTEPNAKIRTQTSVMMRAATPRRCSHTLPQIMTKVWDSNAGASSLSGANGGCGVGVTGHFFEALAVK